MALANGFRSFSPWFAGPNTEMAWWNILLWKKAAYTMVTIKQTERRKEKGTFQVTPLRKPSCPDPAS